MLNLFKAGSIICKPNLHITNPMKYYTEKDIIISFCMKEYEAIFSEIEAKITPETRLLNKS